MFLFISADYVCWCACESLIEMLFWCPTFFLYNFFLFCFVLCFGTKLNGSKKIQDFYLWENCILIACFYFISSFVFSCFKTKGFLIQIDVKFKVKANCLQLCCAFKFSLRKKAVRQAKQISKENHKKMPQINVKKICSISVDA